MARICFTLDDSTDEKISKICEQHNMSKSAWCASAIEAFMRQSDQQSDQLTDQERAELQQLRISSAVMEERAKNQLAAMEELRNRAVHAEGLVQTLMTERQALLPTKTRFWSRLFGKG